MREELLNQFKERQNIVEANRSTPIKDVIDLVPDYGNFENVITFSYQCSKIKNKIILENLYFVN